jgi:tetratricopeptide (TPR) repeat protein
VRIRLATLLVFLGLLGAARADEIDALSPGEREKRAKVHFSIGRAHLDVGEYAAAIESFELGYRYQPRPLFLYNIAQVARLAGQRKKALDHYERYLQASPNASERVEVLQQIAKLQESLAAEVEQRPPVVEVAPAPVPALVAPPVAKVEPPKRSRKRVWIALGVVGGALVAGAVTAGLVVGLRRDSDGREDWGALQVSGR